MQDVRGARLQLCGAFVVELNGRRVSSAFPGRQSRVLVAYLALSRPHPVPRETLIGALWGDAPPAAAAGALSVLVSKVRAGAGAELITGRSQLGIALPEPTLLDVEVALSSVHVAESAVAAGNWRRAWSAALGAVFVARRPFLPEATEPWAESWRRRLAEAHLRALECYATACLELGGPELPGAERAARELLELAPFRETGHLLLMRTLQARGNPAEAIAVFERLRVLLREELGVNPDRAVQDAYLRLLG